MELRQLRYFMAVADELHFGRAARRLHMSQPPLSVQVGRLEREVGVPLFDRSTRRVTLTPAGLHLQERARRILDEVDAVRGEMRDYVDGLAGQLTAGFVSSANYTVLPEVVRLFRSRRDRVTLSLVPLTSGEQIDRLRDGTLDVGLVRDESALSDARAPELTTEVVFEERLVMCVPVTHGLASRAEVTAAEILEVPMIAYPRSLMPGYVDRVHEVLGIAPGAMRIAEEVVHQETALGFVAAGVGASILPESVRQLVPPSIAVIPLAGSPTTRLMAARQARTDESAVCAAFIECLHDAAETLTAARPT
ncbi:LysR family transcriptional regulator [Microbacterium phyllosphaerae]|uniref:LysR family transcriptional regulator n=1 Tax=Microbacterium phyllosphaerae TaxID=124798 RepID=UPI002167E6A0|nr:LysR substrate-binding domain-containing protein [Microbacterium phyllosphaerae]MCS3443046.1 DNA-binding transcriptional LysR family regulator [Microbacterium phyllosphaerae]